MNVDRPRHGVLGLKEVSTLSLCDAGLRDDRLSQWMVTGDEVFVSCVQSIQEAENGIRCAFSVLATIAVCAREYQVPHAIDDRRERLM
jgi:hypothetical protein